MNCAVCNASDNDSLTVHTEQERSQRAVYFAAIERAENGSPLEQGGKRVCVFLRLWKTRTASVTCAVVVTDQVCDA